VTDDIDQQLKELDKQMHRLSEKFGSFKDGLALPSMSKVLTERFGMEVISPSVRIKKQGEHMEIDVLAYANSDVNEAYVVEVKSHAREESIEQLKTILQRFRRFFPEHKDKALFGILAAVDLSDELRERILKAGFYVARIHDQVFELDVPANFRPKAY
jgi:RecB family endonuclease NucS